MDREHQLAHVGLEVVDDELHRTRAVDDDHEVEPRAPESANETAETVTCALAMARADTAADSDSAVHGTHVIVGRHDGLTRRCINLGWVLERQRRHIRHLGFRQVGSLARLTLAAATAGQAYLDRLTAQRVASFAAPQSAGY